MMRFLLDTLEPIQGTCRAKGRSHVSCGLSVTLWAVWNESGPKLPPVLDKSGSIRQAFGPHEDSRRVLASQTGYHGSPRMYATWLRGVAEQRIEGRVQAYDPSGV